MGRYQPSAPIAAAIRYFILISHALLSITVLLLCFLTTGSGLFMIIHLCAIVPVVIYIPPTIILSIKDSSRRFDHAGGEIAYATVECTVWLASAVTATLYRIVAHTCVQYDRNPTLYRYSAFSEAWSWFNDQGRSAGTVCNVLATTAALSYLQVTLTMGWILWLAWLGHHAPGRSPAQAYMLPAHRLVNMNYHNDDDGVDLAEQQQDMTQVNPYVGGFQQAHADEPAPAYDEPYVSPTDLSRAEGEVREMMNDMRGRDVERVSTASDRDGTSNTLTNVNTSSNSHTHTLSTAKTTTNETQQMKRDLLALTAPGPSHPVFAEKR